MPVELDDAEEILREFEIAPPPSDERSVRHGDLEVGTELAIGGHKDAEGRKTLTLTIGVVSQSRSCPLSDDEARDMVERLREHHAIPHSGSVERTLEHLIKKCSRMYDRTELESFSLKPVYLHEGGYRVGGVQLFAARRLKVRPRLRPDAHDRGGAFPHRPSDTH